MNDPANLHQLLQREKLKHQALGEDVLREANRILQNDLFSEEKILQHLKAYKRSMDLLDEEGIEKENIFHVKDIKALCTNYRLRFLDSEHYQPEIPYPAILKIKQLGDLQRKELKHFKILGSLESMSGKSGEEVILFCRTGFDNYYLLHRWGTPLSRWRRFTAWPMRSFENLFIFVTLLTAFVTILLPTGLISLDENIGYWTGFRLAAFFHLLIFNFGVTAYITFAFNKNLSASVWNQNSEF